MNSTTKLLADIDAFLARTGMTATALGVGVRNDCKMLTSLRKPGATVTLDTADRIRAFMASHERRPPSRPRRRHKQTGVAA